MRRTPVVLACALICAALLAAPAAARRGPTVRAELDRFLAAGQLSQADHDAYRATYDDAERTLRRLHGRRFAELEAVLANTDDLAARRLLAPYRMALVFRTLAVNRTWWASRPLLAYGQRVELAGSELVWQAYPGQGLQVQWLGTFGKANALFTGGRRYDARLGALLDEARTLATPRAGGLAWESVFRFDGGRPPWVSALSQGTALQAYSRAAIRLKRPELFAVARAALGIFRTPPPEGVRVDTPVGAHYLQYSYAPRLHVLNGFVQALNGLHDFAALANDQDGRDLFAQGEAQLRVELPAFDTGAWSLYSLPGRESDLGYHELLRDFLRGLCARLTKDGTPDPALYCQTAQRFDADLHTPPALAFRPPSPPVARVKKRAQVRFTLSKVSTVTLTIRRRGAVVFSRTVRFGRGAHAIAWGPPRRPGPLGVELRAVDLAGNAARLTGAVTVRR